MAVTSGPWPGPTRIYGATLVCPVTLGKSLAHRTGTHGHFTLSTDVPFFHLFSFKIMASMATAENRNREEERKIIENFVRALGGGHGEYIGTSAKAKKFQQREAASFENKDQTELGLGFGRIKFPKNDQLTPYIRIPWKKDDPYNNLRAQVSKSRWHLVIS